MRFGVLDLISKDHFEVLDQIVSLQHRPCKKFCDFKSNVGSFNVEEILQSLDAEFHGYVDSDHHQLIGKPLFIKAYRSVFLFPLIVVKVIFFRNFAYVFELVRSYITM